MSTWVAVFIGGGLGSLARYFVAVVSLRFLQSDFPWATFISNMLACIILALTVIVLKDKLINQPIWRFMIITGFCGGFSTFSTFSLETYELFRNAHIGLAIANIAVSVALGVLIMIILLKNVHIQ